MLRPLGKLLGLLPVWAKEVMDEYLMSAGKVTRAEAIRTIILLVLIVALVAVVLFMANQCQALSRQVYVLQKILLAEQSNNYRLTRTVMYQESLIEELREIEAVEIFRGWQAAPFSVTAYAPYDNVSGICNDGDPNATATGSPPTEGTFAVNFEIIPPHSEMVILYEDGSVEMGKALDTGGALRVPGVRKVDVFRRTYKEASRHGIRRATVLWRGKELSQDE